MQSKLEMRVSRLLGNIFVPVMRKSGQVSWAPLLILDRGLLAVGMPSTRCRVANVGSEGGRQRSQDGKKQLRLRGGITMHRELEENCPRPQSSF